MGGFNKNKARADLQRVNRLRLDIDEFVGQHHHENQKTLFKENQTELQYQGFNKSKARAELQLVNRLDELERNVADIVADNTVDNTADNVADNVADDNADNTADNVADDNRR